jgi:hypothetical protein
MLLGHVQNRVPLMKKGMIMVNVLAKYQVIVLHGMMVVILVQLIMEK